MSEPAVVTREAATVVLLRDQPDGLAVWLLRRVPQMAFAAGMTVFPGGGVDAGDARPAADEDQTHIADVAAQLATTEEHAAVLLRAAVRETREEADVDLPLTALKPWSRWMPPAGGAPVNRRYDTYFFVAAMPADAVAKSVTTEAVSSEWVLVAQALAQWNLGERPILPPTFFTLCQLDELGSVERVLAAAPDRDLRPGTSVIETDPDGTVHIKLGEFEWLGSFGRPA